MDNRFSLTPDEFQRLLSHDFTYILDPYVPAPLCHQCQIMPELCCARCALLRADHREARMGVERQMRVNERLNAQIDQNVMNG